MCFAPWNDWLLNQHLMITCILIIFTIVIICCTSRRVLSVISSQCAMLYIYIHIHAYAHIHTHIHTYKSMSEYMTFTHRRENKNQIFLSTVSVIKNNLDYGLLFANVFNSFSYLNCSLYKWYLACIYYQVWNALFCLVLRIITKVGLGIRLLGTYIKSISDFLQLFIQIKPYSWTLRPSTVSHHLRAIKDLLCACTLWPSTTYL